MSHTWQLCEDSVSKSRDVADLGAALPFADIDDVRDVCYPCYIKKLPQEMINAVIDCLEGETEALKSCSLVRSQWLLPARSHLFKIFTAGRTRSVHAFCMFLQTTPPHVATSIYLLTLNFRQGFEEDQDVSFLEVARALSQMPALYELWLINPSTLVVPDSVIPVETSSAINVGILVLQQGPVSAAMLAKLIAFLPKLHALYLEKHCRVLDALDVPDVSQETRRALASIQLTGFAISGGDQAAAMDVIRLTSNVQLSAIIELELNFLRPSWIPLAKTILLDCGANLEALALDLTEFHSLKPKDNALLGSLDLSMCKKLRWLRLDFDTMAKVSESWLRILLPKLAPAKGQAQAPPILLVDLAIDSLRLPLQIGTWDEVLSTYERFSFRFWYRDRRRKTDFSNAFERGRLFDAEEQAQVRELLPKADKAGILQFD